mmetsp:Transcript_4363/g.6514  ORF Transcript_4363/g.6514 Transcript_4363/m.6514 type:complete len:227 (-) Transcript_4363:79-759(-)
MILEILVTADVSSALGRLDYTTMSQQSLMELAGEKITNFQWICGDRRTPSDISEWKGVTLNDNEEVTRIQWPSADLSYKHGLKMRGSVALEWFPATVETILLGNNKLKGTINLHELPVSLNWLELWMNNFSGEVDLTNLPPQLVSLLLSMNKLSGTPDFTCLPETIQTMRLTNNKFSGVADFSKLPDSLEELDLRNNAELGGRMLLRDRWRIQKQGTKIKCCAKFT